jgi:hypothetical protein
LLQCNIVTIFCPQVFHKENELDFKNSYPEYRAIEEHIRRAHLERSVAIAHMIANVIDQGVKGLKALAGAVRGLAASAPRKATLPAR